MGREKAGEAPDEPAGAGGGSLQPRYRADGFTPARRERFLAALDRYKCIADAAYAAQVSRKTVDYHRRKFPDFAAEVATILDKAVRPLENIAWRRATIGAEEKLYRNGKLVQVRVKPSDAMLRLLLQASNPKKYGRLSRGGATRKQIEKQLRAEITREVEAKLTPRVATNEQVREALVKRLEVFGRRVAAGQRPPEAPDPSSEEPSAGEAPDASGDGE